MVVQLLRAVARRWYVVLVGLLLTSGLVYVTYERTPPAYNARALVLLLPSQSAVGKGGNPFLMLSGLEQAAGVVVAYFSSSSAEAEIAAASPTASYQVAIDDSTRGPVIAVGVSDDSPGGTMDALRHIVTRIPVELSRLQEKVDVPSAAVIGSMELTVDEKPAVDRAGTLRMMIAALVLGLVGTAVLAIILDSLIQRRADRRGQVVREPEAIPGTDDERASVSAEPEENPDTSRLMDPMVSRVI